MKKVSGRTVGSSQQAAWEGCRGGGGGGGLRAVEEGAFGSSHLPFLQILGKALESYSQCSDLSSSSSPLPQGWGWGDLTYLHCMFSLVLLLWVCVHTCVCKVETARGSTKTEIKMKYGHRKCLAVAITTKGYLTPFGCDVQ